MHALVLQHRVLDLYPQQVGALVTFVREEQLSQALQLPPDGRAEATTDPYGAAAAKAGGALSLRHNRRPR